MDDDQSMEEIRCNLDKPRLVPYKNTWKPHQSTVYWCNLKLAQKRGLQFYQHDHTQSFSATHHLRFVSRKRYAWRQTRRYTSKYVSLQDFLILCWNRIRKVDDRINLIKNQENPIGKFWWNPQQQHRQQNTRHTSFYSLTTGHESQRNSQTVDSAVRESPTQGVFPAGHETDRKDKCVQREVEEVDHRHG